MIERPDAKIRLWRQQTKGVDQEIVFEDNKRIYDLTNSTERTEFRNYVRDKDLWLEGYSPSGALKDTELKLKFTNSGDQEIHKDLVKVTVFDTELKTYKRGGAELLMDKEKDPGNYIVCNTDDDNGNDTKDVDDPAATTNEDDLQKVRFSFGSIFDNLQTGKVVIQRSSGNLKMWKQNSRTSEIAFGGNEKTYDLSDGGQRTAFANDIKNQDLYMEGTNKSSGIRDTEFTLKYVDSDNVDICKDPVKYTVFKIDLDVNGDGDTDDGVDGIVGYLPGEEGGTPKITYNANIEYTAGQQMKLITEPADGTAITTAVYTVTSCSDEAGFCMNSGALPDTADNDYSFQAASEDTEENGTVSGGKASVNFYCKDYGGYSTVNVALKKGADTVLEIARGIPSDTNPAGGNHCADHWPGDKGPGATNSATDDGDNQPSGITGDGFTRYQEYRGFIVNGNHTRLDVNTRDLFVYDQDSLGCGYYSSGSGINIKFIRSQEWTGTGFKANDKRIVNNNRETAPGSIQYGLHLYDGGAPGGDEAGHCYGDPSDSVPLGPPNACLKIKINTGNIRNWFPVQATAVIDRTIAHEMGHGTSVEHHNPPTGGLLCPMREPCADQNIGTVFCTTGDNCRGQIDIKDP